MSAPKIDERVELDERTKDELQPPCEARRHEANDCPPAATWIVTFLCAACGAVVKFYCDEDAAICPQVNVHHLHRRDHARMRMTRMEPLR